MLDRSKKTRPPSHPGSIIRGLFMEPLKLTVTSLASHLGVSRKTLSKVVNKRGSITPDMAQRLGRAFDTGPELWLNLQNACDLWNSEHTHKDWQTVKPLPGLASVAEQSQV